MKTLSLCVALALACVGSSKALPPAPLEIGVLVGGAFKPLANGDTAPVILGPNGLNMIQPSLRASDIDPRAPDPSVTAEVGGILMAADIEGVQADLKSDGTGYVLRDLRVPFQTDLCCYICREGKVVARLKDAGGRVFEGTVTLRFERGGCPDAPACCTNRNACPDPSLTQLCE